MSRTLAFLAAVAMTTISVSTACFANLADGLSFTLQPARAPGRVQLNLRAGKNSNMSSSFAVSELAGLDLARLRANASSPIRFALVREAGRVDCDGSGRNAHASGSCRFTANAGFAAFLSSRGIARPTRDQSYQLAMVGARRELVDALRAALYPMPDIDELTAMAALGVDRGFIADLSARGYRLREIDHLIQFRALNVTPAFIDGLARAGYRRLTADEIVQLKALNITPGFIHGFARIGYRNLSVDELVQLKALGVTPQFVRQVEAGGFRSPSVGQLVQLRAIGFKPRRERGR